MGRRLLRGLGASASAAVGFMRTRMGRSRLSPVASALLGKTLALSPVQQFAYLFRLEQPGNSEEVHLFVASDLDTALMAEGGAVVQQMIERRVAAECLELPRLALLVLLCLRRRHESLLRGEDVVVLAGGFAQYVVALAFELRREIE